MSRFADLVADVRRQGWAVQGNRVARIAARSGYVAQALLLALIGVLALLIALQHHDRQANASGAFGVIASAPGGIVLLLIVSAGEFALTAWLVLAGVLHRGSSLEDWRRRVVVWGRAPVYAVVGTIALRFALGAHDDGARTARESSQHLLDVPGGAVVLGLIGGVVVVVGLSLVWLGVSRRFVKTIVPPERTAVRRAVIGAGVVGYVARGITITVVGVLLVVAAFTLDAAAATGLDGALGGFATSGPGTAALAAIAAGWIAAGLYTGARAALMRTRE